jgi:pimeloyl-ACP methyl ester carboxylesterase
VIDPELYELAAVPVGDERVAYRTTQPRSDGDTFDAPTDLAVVFIHGMGNSSAVWGPVHSDLAAHGVRAYAADIPGHGASTLQPRTPRFADMAQLLAGFVTQLPQRRVVAVGHSLGAVFALDLALRLPQRVAGVLMFAGPPLDMMDFYAHPIRTARSRPRVLKQFGLLLLAGLPGARAASDVGARIGATVRRGGEGAAEQELDDRAAFASQHLGHGRILATTLGGFGSNYRDAYRSIRQPCVAVLGADDALTHPSEITAYLDSFAGPTSVEVWDGVAHEPMLECVDRTVATVLALVQRVRED